MKREAINRWKQYQLKEVAEIVTGTTPSKNNADFYGGTIPFISPTELDRGLPIVTAPTKLTELGVKQARLLPRNTVMVCCIGSLGKVGIAGCSLVTNQQINSVIFDEDKVYYLYGYYFCKTLKSYLETIAPSTTVAIVNKSRFSEIVIPLPPLAEQKRIAAILDKADAIRRKRQEAIRLADELLRSVFLDMFGDPVTNPKGWEVKRLEELCEKITDGTHKTPTYVDKGVTFLSAKNIQKGSIDWNAIKHIRSEEHQELYRRCNPVKGDILLSKSGSIGAAAIVDKDCAFSLFESVALIKYNRPLIKGEYLLNYLQTESIRKFYEQFTKGISIKHLHLVDIRSLPILLPNIGQQDRFVNIFSNIMKYQKRIINSFEDCENLFNSLVQRAFRGEL